MTEILLERGMPASVDCERAILGSLALHHASHEAAFTVLAAEDFSLEKHRRIFTTMQGIDQAGGRIDRVTLAEALNARGWLQSVDGLTYIVSLDNGLPELPTLDSYIATVKEKAALRKIIFAAQNLMNRCLSAGEDSAAIIAETEQALSTIGRKADGKTAEMLNPGEIVVAAGGLQRFLSPQRGIGIKTPWPRLTDMTGGYRRGELCVVAGNPAMGKSSFALQAAGFVAEHGEGILIFSLEMSRESLVERLACARARVDSSKLRAGYLNSEERLRLSRAFSEVWDWPLWIAEHGVSTALGIRAAIRKQRAKRDIFQVVIDYLQLMKSIGRYQNRNAEVSDITRDAKLLAVDENVNVQLLSQLNRDNMKEKRPPQLHDLRESGCLAGDTLITIATSGVRRPIASLAEEGERFAVWALNTETMKIAQSEAHAFLSGIGKETVTLRTASGASIRATSNHKFLTISGWVPLSDLRIGSCIATPRTIPERGGPRGGRRPDLELLAQLIGNGTMLARQVIHCTSGYPEMAKLVEELATEVFGSEVAPRSERTGEATYSTYLTSTRRHTHGVHSAVSDWLRAHGLWDKRAPEKFVPSAVFAAGEISVAGFLRHLWSTDGHIGIHTTPSIYYGSSSARLAADVRYLLLRCGIISQIHKLKQKKAHYHTQHVVSIQGREGQCRFMDKIGAIKAPHVKAVPALSEYLSTTKENTNIDVIPAEVWQYAILPAMKLAGISARTFSQRAGIAYSGSSLHKNGLGRERARRFAVVAACEELKRLATSDVFWDEVVAIEPYGVEDVYDLTVPAHHNFLCNTHFAHNSIEQDADNVAFVWRPEMLHRDREDLRGLAELLIGKQRAGPTGKIDLVWLPHLAKFENRAEDIEYDR